MSAVKKNEQAKRGNERRMGRIRNAHKRVKNSKKHERPNRYVLHDPGPSGPGDNNG